MLVLVPAHARAGARARESSGGEAEEDEAAKSFHPRAEPCKLSARHPRCRLQPVNAACNKRPPACRPACPPGGLPAGRPARLRACAPAAPARLRASRLRACAPARLRACLPARPAHPLARSPAGQLAPGARARGARPQRPTATRASRWPHAADRTRRLPARARRPPPAPPPVRRAACGAACHRTPGESEFVLKVWTPGIYDGGIRLSQKFATSFARKTSVS